VAPEDELIAIRLELKGLRETISGITAVDKAQKGLGTSTTKAGAAAEKAEKKTSRLGAAYARLGRTAKYGLGFLGVGGVFALKSAVDASEDLAMATSGLTRNFGFNTNVASRWAAVMHGRSVEPKALTMAFATLSSKMVETARSGGTLLTPFHQLGITQEEVARGAKDFEWGVLRVAKALGEEEGGARRSTAAKALLGKGFQTLTPLFSEGVEGLKEQLHWADKYGVTLSTTTKDGLMDMVVAGRESKVAMLGLQVAMTRALMPAIEAGEDELHTFIATLNDPDLSAEQKLRRIERQFLGIEDALINIITDAAPKIAEHGGELGIKLAGAVWHGFVNSNLLGKIVIGGWIFSMLGGEALVMAGAKKVGGKIGTRLGIGLVLGAVGAFAAKELVDSLSDKTKWEIKKWGHNAGVDFVNFFARTVSDGMDELNILSWAGVDAPDIGELDRWEGKGGSSARAPGWAPKGAGTEITSPKSGGMPPRPSKSKGKGRKRPLAGLDPKLPRIDMSAFRGGGGGHTPRPIILQLNGKKIAEVTAEEVAAAEALG
jgi:hypothetical protein